MNRSLPLTFLLLLLVFTAIVPEPVRADDTCSPVGVCKGVAQVSTATGGVGGATRCWQLSTDLADDNSCDHVTDESTWEVDPAGCFTLRFRTDTSGAVPPSAPGNILLEVRVDNAATVVKTLHNGAPPADGTDYTFCATSTGSAGGADRAGTIRIFIEAFFDGVTGDYTVNSDGVAGVGAIQESTKGALRSRMTVISVTRSAYPGGGSLYAYGPSGDETFTITVTTTDRYADTNVETVRILTRDNPGGTIRDTGATIELGTSGVTTTNFVMDLTYQAADAMYDVDFEVIGNSALVTGQKWTYLTNGILPPSSTFLDDSTANNHDLTQVGTDINPITGGGKYGGGYQEVSAEVCANGDSATWSHLKSTDSALMITGPLTIFMVFVPTTNDGLAGNDQMIATQNGATNCPDGENAYHFHKKNEGSITTGPNTLVYSQGNNPANLLTPSLDGGTQYRVWFKRDPSVNTYSSKINGANYLICDNSPNCNVDPVSATFLALQFRAMRVYEVRIWDSLIADATLDEIADANDPDFTNTLQGAEEAAWFFESTGAPGSTTFRESNLFRADPRVKLDKDGSGGYGAADNLAVVKLGGSGGATITLANRGETIYWETFIYNARSEKLSRAMTFTTQDTVPTTCTSHGSLTPSSNKYSVTYALPTSSTCLAANDATGTARTLLVTNTDQSQRSGNHLFVSSLYFTDAHIQQSNTLSKDDFPTQDSTEQFSYITGAHLVNLWCHIEGVRLDGTEVDTSGAAVSWNFKNPSGTTTSSGTDDTGSDGWTPNGSPHTISAAAPVGIWTSTCAVTFNGNTGTDTESWNAVSAFTGTFDTRLYLPNPSLVNVQVRIYARTTDAGSCFVPDAPPRIEISHINPNTSPATIVTDVNGVQMRNVVDGTQTVNSCLYYHDFTPTTIGVYNVHVRANYTGAEVDTSTPWTIVFETPSLRIVAPNTVPPGESVTVYVRLEVSDLVQTPDAVPMFKAGRFSSHAFTETTPYANSRNLVNWAQTINGAQYAFNWTPTAEGAYNVQYKATILGTTFRASEMITVGETTTGESETMTLIELPGMTSPVALALIIFILALVWSCARGFWWTAFASTVGAVMMLINQTEWFAWAALVFILGCWVEVIWVNRQARREEEARRAEDQKHQAGSG